LADRDSAHRKTDMSSLQRFGNAITSRGVLNLKHARYAEDFGPVEEGCTCMCCRPKEDGGLGISRAYVCHLAAKETVGAHLYVFAMHFNLRPD
jgi:tRNA-guanine family transglycosylase